LAAVNTAHPLITLTTDFGRTDNYVGVMKGVIAGLNPKAAIIDLSHDIPPQNITAGRYIVETSIDYFPPGTIHIAVVDPGVGTRRKAILIETDNYFLIGPDNGVFSFLTQNDIKKVISLSNKKYFLRDITATFHGRDIFAPVVAFLSLGVIPEEFGHEIKSITRPKIRLVRKTKSGLIGRLVYIDHFGNLVSSIKAGRITNQQIVFLNGRKIGPIRTTFGNVKKGKALAYINSSGYLEIGVNKGSAAGYFGIDYCADCQILIAPE
jgi:S-adenosylmethionine hydrolase